MKPAFERKIEKQKSAMASIQTYLRSLGNMRFKEKIEEMLSGDNNKRASSVLEAHDLLKENKFSLGREKIIHGFLYALQDSDPLVRRVVVYSLASFLNDCIFENRLRQTQIPERQRIMMALKASLFDMSSIVRKEAAVQLPKLIGYRGIVKLINSYPEKLLSNMPEDFLGSSYPKEAPKEKPAFFHRGFPVYLGKEPSLGMFHGKFFLLEKNEKVVPLEFRETIAEHEFGEIFSHEIGLAMEMIWLEKGKMFNKYLKAFPKESKDFQKIAKERSMRQFLRYFQKQQ